MLCTLFQNVLCMQHGSTLRSIIDNQGIDISQNFVNLVGNSNPNDIQDVCYGTGNGAAQANARVAHNNKQPFPVVNVILPRCHSEFFLLQAIIAQAEIQNINLNRCKIIINNSQWPPCKMAYGQTINYQVTRTEYNPGTPCHVYLQNFATDNQCKIMVCFPPNKHIFYE